MGGLREGWVEGIQIRANKIILRSGSGLRHRLESWVATRSAGESDYMYGPRSRDSSDTGCFLNKM